nr:autotransporter assembly complex family protein [Mesocricetibacter intestinalis]
MGILCSLSLIATNGFAAQQVELKVTGIKGENANKNVRLYLAAIDKEEADGSERYQRLVGEAIDKALRVYGYYNIRVNFNLQPGGKGKGLLIADVAAGQPVRIEATDVEIRGDAEKDEAFHQLNKKIPQSGAILTHQEYEDYKSGLQKLAAQRGYFDADFFLHQLEVMPSTNQGWWRIGFDSGTRYRYGEISFGHSQIRTDYLRNMLNIQSGQPYLINEVSAMTNIYTSSGWFQSVLVEPKLNAESKTVDLKLLTYPKKKNSMEVGIGYSSDVGPRLQLGWVRPWINSRGHSLRSDLYLSSPKQTFEATYKIPLLKNPTRYYYEYAAGVENENKNDTKSLAATGAALRYWNHPTGWQYSFGARVRYDKFTQADVEDKTLLFYPTASVTRSRLSGGLFPRRADTVSATFDYAKKFFISDVDFYRIRVNAGWLKTFADNHRILTRAEIGYLHTNELKRIPPALRFFAGGDRSVRGYGYKKISPKDHKGKYVGASRLATATLEYQYQVIPDWWLATFVDSGLAADSYSTDQLRYGAGIGVRWASPVGAVKLDVATPVRDKDNSKNLQFYIGLGSEL